MLLVEMSDKKIPKKKKEKKEKTIVNKKIKSRRDIWIWRRLHQQIELVSISPYLASKSSEVLVNCILRKPLLRSL